MQLASIRFTIVFWMQLVSIYFTIVFCWIFWYLCVECYCIGYYCILNQQNVYLVVSIEYPKHSMTLVGLITEYYSPNPILTLHYANSMLSYRNPDPNHTLYYPKPTLYNIWPKITKNAKITNDWKIQFQRVFRNGYYSIFWDCNFRSLVSLAFLVIWG